jgi:cobalt/nickel transport system permease protein
VAAVPLLAMHIPDGFLDPLPLAVTALLAILAVAYALRRVRLAVGDRLAPLMGVMAAGIFAGQMVNFPLIGLQTSGHLMGGVLAAAILGPWGGMVALTVVIVVQCLVFGDGGVSALGANVLNIAVIGAGIGYIVYSSLRRLIGGDQGTAIAAVIASWLIVPLAAIAFAAEMSAGGQVAFRPIATLMLFYHALIGLGEALLTGSVIVWIQRVRPDLLYGSATAYQQSPRLRQAVAAGLTFALAVAIFIAPLASGWDDGLEMVANRLGFADQATDVSFALFPDYALRNPSDGQTSDWLQAAAVVTSLLGCLGTLITWGFALTVARSVRAGAQPSG